jgi:HAD superfamily hydrolase (TIGR01509 family)
MRLAQMPGAVVFDMDGLLFDTEAIVREAARAASTRLSLEMPDAVFLSLIGLSADEGRKRLVDHYGASFDCDAFWRAVDEDFHRLLHGRTFLKAGVVELLDWLDDRNLPRAIATSSGHNHVQRNLAIHDLSGRFHAVVADGDCALGKPNPHPFLKAAERLGVPAGNCLALEDSPNGVRAASAAGMMTIMVPDLIQPSDEIRRRCIHVARDLHEVREMLTRSVSSASGRT